MHAVAGPFTSHHKERTFAEPNRKIVTFLNFTMQDHILSATGDALRGPTQKEREGTSVKLVPSGPAIINK